MRTLKMKYFLLKKINDYCYSFLGVGIAMVTVSFLVSVYYNVILAWSIYYLYNSFKPDIPWVGCHHTWNTDSCYEVGSKSNITNTTRVSSSREFFM